MPSNCLTQGFPRGFPRGFPQGPPHFSPGGKVGFSSGGKPRGKLFLCTISPGFSPGGNVGVSSGVGVWILLHFHFQHVIQCSITVSFPARCSIIPRRLGIPESPQSPKARPRTGRNCKDFGMPQSYGGPVPSCVNTEEGVLELIGFCSLGAGL